MLNTRECQLYNVRKPKIVINLIINIIIINYYLLICRILTSLKKWQYSAAKYNIMLSFNPSRHNISANFDNSATFFISEKLHSPL